MKKIFIAIVFVIALVGICILIYIFNKPRNTIESIPANYKISSEQLVNQFVENSEIYSKKYFGKVILVDGIIFELNFNKSAGANCILKGESDIAGVICEFEPEAIDDLKQYKIGDKVSIKGKFSGFLMDVVLNTCTVDKK